ASTGYVSTAAAYSAAITQVTVTIDAITTDYVNSITLYTSSDGSAWSSAGTFTKALGAQTVALASPTANLYYKVEFNCAQGAGNGFVQVSQIQFYRAPDENMPSYTATFYSNGSTFHTTSLKEGQPIDFPENTPEDVAGRRFMGWATAEIVGTQAQKPDVVASATMSTSDVNFYAVFATISEGQYADVLSNSVIDLAHNTSYSSWSGITMSSSAVYAGNSSGNGGNLRLRSSNSNSGVVTTTSGGKAKKITINWNYNTAKTINIYGKNTAYNSAEDLYSDADATKGTLLAQYTYNNQYPDELTIEGDYAYVGVRSNGGAIDLDNITFTWDGISYSDYCTTFTVANTCGDGLTWDLTDGVLTITYDGEGTGAMADYTTGTAPWYENRADITSIVIPSGVTSIGDYAFEGCNNASLTSVDIPSSVTSVGASAFDGCSNLATATFGAASLTEYGANAFASCSSSLTIWVPNSAAVTAFIEGDEGAWNNHRIITRVCGDGLTWDLTDGVLTISKTGEGTGAMNDYTSGTTPWYADRASITSVTIGSGVTSIGDYAFRGCNNASLTSITIPSSVTSVGKNAFENCTSLNTVLFEGTSITTRGADAFKNCAATIWVPTKAAVATFKTNNWSGYNITTRDCGGGVTWHFADGVMTLTYDGVGTGVMYDYEETEDRPWDGFSNSITSAIIGEGVKVIGEGAFRECENLVTVTFDGVCQVESIRDWGFFSCEKLSSLTLPASVKSIGSNAFDTCTGLESIDLNTLQSIGWGGFANCNKLTSVIIPATVTSMGGHSFIHCQLLETVTFKTGNNGLTMGELEFNDCPKLATVTFETGSTGQCIGNRAFSSCPSLVNLDLGNVQSIDWAAFANCSSLATVTIPSTVTTIGDNPFQYCPALATITVDGENETFNSNGDCNAIIKTSNNALITGCMNTVIPNTVTSIAKQAFQGSSSASFTTITIPSSVTSVGTDAFYDCSNLATATFGAESLTTYGSNAFKNCSGSLIIWVYSNEALAAYKSGNWATYNIQAISGTGYTLTDGVLTIKYEGVGTGEMDNYTTGTAPWYENRESITAIVIEDGVTTLGDYAFEGCNNASLTSVTLPESVTNIGANTFNGCSNLATVGGGSNVETIGTDAFTGTPWNSNMADGITYVGKTLYKGKNINGGLDVETGTTSISANAFNGCTGLTAITIPATVTSVGDNAFDGCTGLTAVTIPATVTSVGDNAFDGCSNLTTATFKGTTITTKGANAFANCNGSLVIYVPNSDAVATFKSGNWSGYNIQVAPCGDGLTWDLTDGVLTISGSGAIYDYTAGTAPWYADRASITSIVIESGVTGIGTYAFDGCTAVTKVIENATTPPALADNAFPEAFVGPINVPVGSFNDYSVADGWSNYLVQGLSDFIDEGFEGGSTPSGWSTTTGYWTINDYDGAATGSYKANFYYDWDYDSDYSDVSGILITPEMNLSGCPSATLSFNLDNEGDIFKVLYRTNGGDWNEIYSLHDYYGEYTHVELELPNLADNYQIGFEGIFAEGIGINIDDVLVRSFTGAKPTLTANYADGSYWCTYYNSTTNVKVDEFTKVYTASVSGTNATLHEIADRNIKAGEGVVLNSSRQTIVLTYNTTATTGDFTGNVLKGVDAATTTTVYTAAHAESQVFYTLANEGALGFYKYKGTTLAANKAFLPLNAAVSASVKGFTFSFEDGETTGISDVRSNMSDGIYYDLQGRRVDQPTKGLYIRNGKKIVVK
ncbi:MAG: leucine-rich repeat domain-containing protein, partial [Bacteroidaceae bacterium]|nr:leucine-rich repeat domain-containing protein [Bacteroidaceae bacterium]